MATPAPAPAPRTAFVGCGNLGMAILFGALRSGALQPGETMRFCNDHDPLPLLAQLQQRYGQHLEITYLQREPGAIVIDFVVVA